VQAHVLTSAIGSTSEALEGVASMMLDDGWDIERHAVDVERQIPRRDRDYDSTAAAFQHTPQALIESWRFAASALPLLGDDGVVLVDDRSGLAGILALDMANHRVESNLLLWTVAGYSNVLRRLRIGESLATIDDEMESILDWEITQYRFSDRVICRSDLEVELLAEVGVDATLVSHSRGTLMPVHGESRLIYVPGAVSRLNAFPEVLRTIADTPDVSAVFGTEDDHDEYWKGTTWEAFGGPRHRLGDRVGRSPAMPTDTDLVVLGDPFADHDEIVRQCADRSISVAAPKGSVVAQIWDGIAVWGNEDDLARIVDGERSAVLPVAHRGIPALTDRTTAPQRASRITVGIPVYGDAPYLGELIESVMNQTTSAHEVIIVMDGSPSAGTRETISECGGIDGAKLTVLEQPNRGVCVARNAMLDAMTGDAVLLIDQDDVLDTRALELLADALRSNPRHAVVASWTEFFGEYNAIEAKPPFDRRVGSRENPIVSTAALIDRSALGTDVRFEPDLAFLYCEDWNFWAELVADGSSFGLVPRPLVRHRVHKASGGFSREDLALVVGRDRARRKLS